jgi:hypothetical protein
VTSPHGDSDEWPPPRRPVDQLTGKPISNRQWRKINSDDYPEENAVQSLAPQSKVVAGTVAGALTVCVAYVADLAGLELPPAVTAAVTVLLTVATAYLRSDRDRVR